MFVLPCIHAVKERCRCVTNDKRSHQFTFVGQGDVVLEDARHPCLEVQDYVTFIPNNVDMLRGND
jgi:DNA mismatch repair ATPase MutS